jgi:hypothetical protein
MGLRDAFRNIWKLFTFSRDIKRKEKEKPNPSSQMQSGNEDLAQNDAPSNNPPTVQE